MRIRVFARTLGKTIGLLTASTASVVTAPRAVAGHRDPDDASRPRRHSASVRRDSIRAAQPGADGRRAAVVFAAMVVCGAVAVGAAPDAAAEPDPGGVSSCPTGFLATSATGSFVGAAATGGPGQSSGRTSGNVEKYGELVGIACYQRTGGTATMRFRWSSVGRVRTGSFVYQLVDCTTGRTSDALTRRLDYETPAGTSGEGEATLKVNRSHTYRMRIRGGGTYERKADDGLTGTLGYWGIAPTDKPKWSAQTTCA